MIEIKNPKTVIAKCKSLLADSLDTNYFDFTKLDTGPEHRLTGNDQTNAVAGPVRYPVLPLNIIAEVPFWIAIDLTFFRDAEGPKISAMSLVFFEGEPFDNDKTPLIRAEWDPWVGQEHAQPHWHIYPTGLKQADASQQASFQQEPEVQEFGSPAIAQTGDNTRLEMEKFHFPMLAGWHLEPPLPIETKFSEKSACQWVGSCVSYTRKQLAYLKRVPF